MIQTVQRGVLYSSEDHLVYRSLDQGRDWQFVCRLEFRQHRPLALAKDLLLRNGLVRALRRNVGIHNLAVLPSGTILIQYDGIYRYDGSGTVARFVYGFGVEQLHGPLKNGFVFDECSGQVYFGEYQNSRPFAARIVRGSRDGQQWDVCYRFPPGAVRHIHSLVPDPYRRRLWICTGDNDQEAGLYYTDDDFRSVHRFAGGDQSWRMVSLIPLPDALVWGSDAGQDAPAAAINQIYHYDMRTGRRDIIACIDKPAYYATRMIDGSLYLGTTFEPGLKRSVNPSADLWRSLDGQDWSKVASWPYWPSGRANRTRYATLNLPTGDGSAQRLYLTPENVTEGEFQLLEWSLTNPSTGGLL